MQIRKMLDISTAHLPLGMRQDTDGAMGEWGGAVGVHPTEDGFLVWVPDDPEGSAANAVDPLPLALIVLQKRARALGCDWILLDADGEVLPDLVAYEFCYRCDLDVEAGGECVGCHVHFGDPCPACGEAGYHADSCPTMGEASA